MEHPSIESGMVFSVIEYILPCWGLWSVSLKAITPLRTVFSIRKSESHRLDLNQFSQVLLDSSVKDLIIINVLAHLRML